jgi:RHS repeat-associated protein
LQSVKDPTGGLTTMKYDVVNRLIERVLPNGIKSSYEYDELDRVKSIVHTSSSGGILASVSYEREGIGEPTKITREDGSYVKLEYDDALRVKKESYYKADGTLLDETAYTYDASGKRLTQSTTAGNRNYSYTPGYQLDTISESGETENYDYDANGRLTLISRDGKTLDLNHDVYDRLTEVENETNGSTIEYIYDGAGNRIKSVEGTGQRSFLVAPVMGEGLDSTDLIADGNGNLISNYIYAGGISPFMRLDASGNPVYYLTDAMGTTIGLADGAGAEVADFRYDSFGNLRGSSGSIIDGAGGDFRFQGQWLEEKTGIYHFRARDYDPATGLFLSRDPVDPLEYEPESTNPYQFVYNNPFVYSDPTGMFSISEIQTAQQIDNILQQTQSIVARQAYEYFVDRAKGVVGDLLFSSLKSLMPNMWGYNYITKYTEQVQGELVESFIKDQICQFFGGKQGSNSLVSHLWFNAEIKESGEPNSNGFNCSNSNGEFFIDKPNIPNPDFIFKKGEIKDADKNPKAWLIGDIKGSLRELHNKVVLKPKGQWEAISSYAQYNNRHQYTPLTFFIVFRPGNGTKTQLEIMEKDIAKEAFQKNVITYLLKILE